MKEAPKNFVRYRKCAGCRGCKSVTRLTEGKVYEVYAKGSAPDGSHPWVSIRNDTGFFRYYSPKHFEPVEGPN